MIPSANKTLETTEVEDSSYAIGFVLISELSSSDLFGCFFKSQTLTILSFSPGTTVLHTVQPFAVEKPN